MLSARTYTVSDIIRILRRRWWQLVLPVAAGAVLGVVAYGAVPPRYQAQTVIMVVQQRIPENYVKALVSGGGDERLRAVSEQVESRAAIEQITRELDPYRVGDATPVSDGLVERMRGEIGVTLVGNDSLFRVSYVHTDPVMAQRVADRLAALYIELTQRDRERLVEGTTKILDTQLQDAKQRLMAQEQRLEDYRRQYAGELPSQLEANLQSVQNAQTQLHSTVESINRARDNRLAIERQLTDAQIAAGIMAGTPDTPTTSAASPAALQLDAARAKLAELKLSYTRNHPDVIATEQMVNELEAQVASEATRPQSAADAKRPLSASERARLKQVADLRADLQKIDRQIAAGLAEEARLRGLMAAHQSKIDLMPARESQLVELTRDYTALQETYSNLLQKREDSTLAVNLERGQAGGQFRILDPASVPTVAENQDVRLAVLAAGPLGGLVLGLLLVGLLEIRDTSFRHEEDVLRVLSLPVLALVPRVDLIVVIVTPAAALLTLLRG